jgi:hypothetical protein
MKSLLICLAAVLCSSAWAGAQSSNPHKDPTDFLPPIDRGEGIVGAQTDAHRLERQTDQPAQPGIAAGGMNLAQIKQDSDELSRLAELVSNEISASEKGAVPKDLSENLKKIQKLSKCPQDELKL